jgi:hypothetical protein
MATETKDSSVVFALSELVRMESDRIEADREREQRRIEEARAERERIEAAARETERVRAEQAAQATRVAEAEARLRVEADRERDQRIAAMRLELARVESDRLALRSDLERRVLAPERSRPNGWALAFGLSSLVAASLAGVLVMQGAHTAAQPVAHLTQPAPIVVHAPLPVAAPVPVVTETAPAPAVVATHERVHPRRDHDRPRVEHRDAHDPNEIVGLSTEESSDVIDGLTDPHQR